ncbi:hypothetical protein H4219_000274 [Mycoemilia scoparia]|uniref:Mediator of RNA polymerase II transcription subunit 4 n=1 Tax=Mycoemilia scoparia TaxID=417184 RepID=A0A9W8A379_9FUNG|nr:hypothetical protein H4219_000274 [Mycoemilia scoparia]
MTQSGVSIHDLLRNTLREYNSAIRSLLESFVSTNNQHDLLKASEQRQTLTSNIIQLDKQLQELYYKIKAHHERQARIRVIQEEILECDSLKKRLATQLFETKDSLEHSLSEASEQVEATNKAKQNKLEYKDILHYANKLSAFTSAPPNFSTTQQSVGGYELPYPLEVAMHASLLNHLPAILSKDTDKTHEEELDDTFIHQQDGFQFGDLDDEDILDLVLNPDLD